MKRSLIVLLCAAGWGCEGFSLHRGPSIPPSNVKVAVRLAVNKSPQFGLEDKLTAAIRDEALREGRFPLVQEKDAERLIEIVIQRYIVQPAQYDADLNPISYKLRVGVDLRLLDRDGKTVVYQEKDLDGVQTYASDKLPGGLSEQQAQGLIWDALSRDIVEGVARGLAHGA